MASVDTLFAYDFQQCLLHFDYPSKFYFLWSLVLNFVLTKFTNVSYLTWIQIYFSLIMLINTLFNSKFFIGLIQYFKVIRWIMNIGSFLFKIWIFHVSLIIILRVFLWDLWLLYGEQFNTISSLIANMKLLIEVLVAYLIIFF